MKKSTTKYKMKIAQRVQFTSIACLILLTTGCGSPYLNYDVKNAKNVFKERQLNGAPNNESKVDEARLDDDSVVKVRKKLIQFKYSSKSFESSEFKDFLKQMGNETEDLKDEAMAKKSHAEWLSEESAISRDRNALRRSMVIEEMKNIQDRLNGFGSSADWLKEKSLPGEITFRDSRLPVFLRGIASQSGSSIRFSEAVKKSKLKVSGSFTGNLNDVFEKLIKNYPLQVMVNDSSQDLFVVTSEEYEKNGAEQGFSNLVTHATLDSESQKELAEYREIVMLLATGETARFNRRVSEVRPYSANPVITSAFDLLNRSMVKLSNKLKDFDQGTAKMLSKNQRNSAANFDDIPQSIIRKGTLDSKICPGRELITEKIYVYKESPKEIVRHLSEYFKVPGVNGINGINGANVNGMNPPNGMNPLGMPAMPLTTTAQTSSAFLDQVKAKLVQSDTSKKEDSKGDGLRSSANSVEKEQNNQNMLAALQEAEEKKYDPCNFVRENEGLKIIEDPTGVILTATVPQIEIANRLVEDADVPTKQVLAEVFMVEVQKNWAQTLEIQLAKKGLNASGISGSVSQLYNAANIATNSNPGGVQGQITARGGNVSAFINMLETNSVGRSISSPTLVAKNGEEAKISKVITLRNEVQQSTPAQIVGGATIPALPNFVLQTLDIPLVLKIKPNINLHNKHVTMKFDYEETTINPGNYATPTESGTTKNVISTVFETAPGDIVVLAGLFQESNSKVTSGMPGTTGAGALSALLGGNDNTSTSSTELLLFIKPTVIEPKAYVAKSNSLQ
jgi:type II secretory pathway component GspD/PulD (secretin)